MAVLNIALISIFLLLTSANNEFYLSDSHELKDFCARLITNNTAVVQWFDPLPLRAEKQGYTIFYTRNFEDSLLDWSSITIGMYPLVTIRDIILGETYYFRVRVNLWTSTSEGSLSEIQQFSLLNRTKTCYDDLVRTTTFLRATAVSKTSVVVWWNIQYDPHEVKGFVVFYGTSDLSIWFNKTAGLENSVELKDLIESKTYVITIAAITNYGLHYYAKECTVTLHLEQVPLNVKVVDVTADSIVFDWSPPIRISPVFYKISYDGSKYYVDSYGVTKHYTLDKSETLLDHQLTSYELLDLLPYTDYSINISAVPIDNSYRPPINLKVRTDVSAPGLMEKPTINGVINGDSIQVFLPKASEENGPISYYYLIVVPEADKSDEDVSSSVYATEDLLESQWFDGEDVDAPYIAAKFPSGIPYAFILGGGGIQGGLKNYKLDSKRNYKIFVRAVVVTSQGHLFTDSPYSNFFSVETERENSSLVMINDPHF